MTEVSCSLPPPLSDHSPAAKDEEIRYPGRSMEVGVHAFLRSDPSVEIFEARPSIVFVFSEGKPQPFATILVI